MQEVIVQAGMSLFDVSLKYYDTLERSIDIAEVNSLLLDYTFAKAEKIKIPDYAEKLLVDMNTGLEGEHSWVWLLDRGRYNIDALWVDYEWWRDR